ncbi:Vesicle-associated membrane protein [Phlyctochytrium bullatum]|nr:Vesicle-associated membrane protein [Phlyctochytrium bullatum]
MQSLVARGPVILAEHATTTGNFTTITQHILEKIPDEDSKMTYVYDRYLFHYIQQRGITYLCLTDDTFGRRIPFAFLEDISRRFESLYAERAQTAIAYGLNEFSRTIASQMEFYSSDPSSDRLRQVQGDIDQVKDVMVSNIERVLERGERIEILVDKTDNLNQASFAFKKRSTALRRELWWKNSKLLVAIGGAVLLLLYILASISCGFPVFQKCHA